MYCKLLWIKVSAKCINVNVFYFLLGQLNNHSLLKDCVKSSNGVSHASSLRYKFLSFPCSELLSDWS